ncbi:sodium channel modifier 1 [Exaiptasia diaphana]|uniref:Sodium channel modifier 1 n=1 Tax=Exaiptasia diaphana TaxID=2652724 RepID=A0A913XUZ7_EXADI|nr:sodium channel modifier 1 [Exaiptasia diaphana]KXJ09167.1 Sodium channel modifier 1 [Exaiptasia diaphana]
MSFKRVADDFDDFNIQRKRRVNDLLLDNIPSDEITLMSNGKLACLVCHHRPVFDTTAMISLHRNGKKHLANVLVKLERAKEDAEIRQRREHEEYLKSSSESPLIGKTKKNKELVLNSSSHRANVAERKVGDNKTPSNSFTYKGKTMDGSFCNQESFTETCGDSRDTSTGRTHGEATAQAGFFKAKTTFNSQTSYTRDYESSSSSTQNISKQTQNKYKNNSFLRKNETINPSSAHLKQDNHSKSSTTKYNHLGNRKDLAKQRFLSVNPLTQQQVQPEGELCSVSENKQNDGNSTHNISTAQQELSEYDKLDQNSKALYVSKLRQLGWVLGLDGKWLKDENAEFDSDEEEPPSPKTVLK